MMYRPNQPSSANSEEQQAAAAAAARRRLELQASFLRNSAASGSGSGELEIQDPPQEQQQQFQIQQLRDQEMLREARAAAFLEQQQQQQQQKQQRSFALNSPSRNVAAGVGMSSSSLQQQLQEMEWRQQQQRGSMVLPSLSTSSGGNVVRNTNSTGELSGPGGAAGTGMRGVAGPGGSFGLGGSSMVGGNANAAASANSLAQDAQVASMLQDRLANLQRAQLEAQIKAQAEAEARAKAFLSEEAQIQEQLRQIRQRQQLAGAAPSGTSASGGSAANSSAASASAPSSLTAFDMMSANAGLTLKRLGNADAVMNRLEDPSSSARRASTTSPSALAMATRTAALFSNASATPRDSVSSTAGGVGRGANPLTPSQQFKMMKGDVFLGGNPASSTSAGAGSKNVMNNILPDASRREEDQRIFGKISRLPVDQAVTADMTLEIQSRQDGLSDGSNHSNKSADKDDFNKQKKQAGLKDDQADTEAGYAAAAPVEEDDEDDDDKLTDEEFFESHPLEPNADGNYPMTREAFPLKLYRILYEAQQNGQEDIISWFPHGRAFVVHKNKEFTQEIMPKYFPAGRMNTFLKQLNLYGFRRITEGRDKGGYFHKDFNKGKRSRCKRIKRKKIPSKPSAALQQQSQQLFLEQQQHELQLLQQQQLLLQQQQGGLSSGLTLDQLYGHLPSSLTGSQHLANQNLLQQQHQQLSSSWNSLSAPDGLQQQFSSTAPGGLQQLSSSSNTNILLASPPAATSGRSGTSTNDELMLMARLQSKGNSNLAGNASFPPNLGGFQGNQHFG